MPLLTQVIVKVRVQGTHRWPEAPLRRGYLRYAHPHQFTFVASRLVNDPDREIEFHDLRDEVGKAVLRLGSLDLTTGQIHLGEQSCEMLARRVLEATGSEEVEVWEDEDCGARVWRAPDETA